LYVDEKVPITAKTPGGSSWSSVQVKVEKAQIKGILNVFREHMIIQMTKYTYTLLPKKEDGKTVC